jgi:hypothetical protein
MRFRPALPSAGEVAGGAGFGGLRDTAGDAALGGAGLFQAAA